MANAHKPGFGAPEYEQKCRSLTVAMDLLRKADVDKATDLHLPAIVVVGQQSSGKSSVMEAISGVPFPRDADMCTMGPVEVRLRQGDTQNSGGYSDRALRVSSIGIRREYDEKLVNDQLVCAKLEAIENVKLDCNSIDALGEKIAEAQGDLLRKQMDPQAGQPQDKRLGFTRNTVVVELHGASVDLTLIDLPGIIEAVKGYTGAELPKEMLLEYAAKPNTIILAVLSCSTDHLRNSPLLDLLTKADPQLERCMGVVTKPDLVNPGATQDWIDLINGTSNDYQMTRGYFMVVNPSQLDLKAAQKVGGHQQSSNKRTIGYKEARQQEQSYFASPDFKNRGWDKVDIKRLGADNLRQALSRQLAELMDQQRDPIMKQIKIAELACLEELQKVPELHVDEVAAEAIYLEHVRLVYDDLKDITHAAQPGLKYKQFWNGIRADDFHKFGHAIMDSQHVIQLQSQDGVSGQPVFLVCSEWAQLKRLDTLGERKALTETVVKQVVHDEIGMQVPGVESHDALLRLVKRSQKAWEKLAVEVLESVANKLKIEVEKIVKDQFQEYPQVLQYASEELGTLHEETLAVARKAIKENAKHELLYPITFDIDYQKALQKQLFAGLCRAYVELHGGQYGSDAEYVQLLHSNNEVIADVDATTQVLKFMSLALAYSNIAARRFSDNVLLKIHGYLVSGYAKRIYDKLVAPTGRPPYTQWLEPSAHIHEHRSQLSQQQKLLHEAYDALRGVARHAKADTSGAATGSVAAVAGKPDKTMNGGVALNTI